MTTEAPTYEALHKTVEDLDREVFRLRDALHGLRDGLLTELRLEQTRTGERLKSGCGSEVSCGRSIEGHERALRGSNGDLGLIADVFALKRQVAQMQSQRAKVSVATISGIWGVAAALVALIGVLLTR